MLGRNFVSTFSSSSVCLAWIVFWFASAAISSAADPISLKRPIRADKDVVFAEVKGQKLRADVYRPDDDKLRPAVMMIHGGAWSSGDKWNLSDHARELAQAGYVAVSINYRLAPQWKFPAQ
ncbi:MAG: alpha/beta hydrolase, partial [Pirellulales bacterium]